MESMVKGKLKLFMTALSRVLEVPWPKRVGELGYAIVKLSVSVNVFNCFPLVELTKQFHSLCVAFKSPKITVTVGLKELFKIQSEQSLVRFRRNVNGCNRNRIEVGWGENYDRNLDLLEWGSGENCA
ncbi:hypothetical protein TNCV_4817471 [Trichonephila clavipes]|nr:hypothetical protein TNCV_4817471 [Trichonephila clavipes]